MRRFYTALFTGIIVTGVCIFFATPQKIGAQYEITEEDVTILSDPEVPPPLENVTLTLSSYATDINSAFIIWKVAGKTELSGTGEKKFQLTTGETGSTTIIDVTIRPVTGELLQKQFVVRPADIDILWEGADSYIPPFYKGRALPTSEGLIKILAIPQVKDGALQTDVNNFVFKWKRDDKVIQSGSGYGKNSLFIRQSYLNKKEALDVSATGIGTGVLTQKKFDVPIFKPKILFYEKDPLLGIKYNRTLDNSFEVASGEKTIIAEPYFFGPSSALSPELEYTWTINGQTIQTPQIKNNLTIKKGTSAGVANIGLEVKNVLRLFMNGKAQTDVTLR
jgi:hypothetical protein